MSESIPEKIIRNIIADILFNRANCIDNIAEEIGKHEVETLGYNTEYAGEVGWTACGTRVLSDDIREGIIPLEQAVEVLTPLEKKEAKRRCQKWLKESQENLER